MLFNNKNNSKKNTRNNLVVRCQCTMVLVVLLVLWAAVATNGSSINKYCGLPCDINGRISEHTNCQRRNVNCGPDPRCGPDYQPVYLTEDDRKYIVDLHNYLRNKVAMGQETRNNQPPAANMNVLKYNRELETIAQCWVNACNARNGQYPPHDVCRRTAEYEYVGQNIGYRSSTNVAKLDVAKTIKSSILAWYNEVAQFQSSWVQETRIRQAHIGHYTQVVWADTTEIGCSLSYYTGMSGRKWHYLLFACNYGISGNILGSPVYEIGIPASKCQSGRKHPTYDGLCSSGGTAGAGSIFGSPFNSIFTFNITRSFGNIFP